eukprot:tig00021094_g18118.t1
MDVDPASGGLGREHRPSVGINGAGAGASAVGASPRMSAAAAAGQGSGAGAGGSRSTRSTVEDAFYSVLFVMRSRSTTAPGALARALPVALIFLDWIQMMAFVADSRRYDWLSFDGIDSVFKVVMAPVPRRFLASSGYASYIALFAIVLAIVALSFADVVWVLRCFHINKFTAMWPVKMLNLYLSTFGILLMSLDCHYFDSSGNAPRFVLTGYPSVACWGFPNAIVAVLAGVGSICVLLFAFSMALVDVDPNPSSRFPSSTATPYASLHGSLCRALLVVAATVFSSYPALLALSVLLASLFLAASVVFYLPYYSSSINYLRSGLYGVVAWCSVCALALSGAASSDRARPVTYAFAAGAPFAFAAFFAAAALRFRRLCSATRHLTIEAADEGDEPVWIYTAAFRHPHEVEVATRFLRPLVERKARVRSRAERMAAALEHELDEALEKAEAIFQARTRPAQDPEPSVLWLIQLCMRRRGCSSSRSRPSSTSHVHSNFLQSYAGEKEEAAASVERARHFPLSFALRYLVFRKLKEREGEAATLGTSKSMDLMRLAREGHLKAAKASRAFWSSLLDPDESAAVAKISQLGRAIDTFETQAERNYEVLVRSYPRNIRLLRAFGSFLELIKNDPAEAEVLYRRADAVEDEMSKKKGEAGASGDMDNENGTGGIDQEAIIVMNAQEIITSVNASTLRILGYREKSELVGKKIHIMVPSPFREAHTGFVQSYLKTGVARVLRIGRELPALHRSGHIVPIFLSRRRRLGLNLELSGLRGATTDIIPHIDENEPLDVVGADGAGRRVTCQIRRLTAADGAVSALWASFVALPETADEAIVTINAAGKILSVNRALCSMFGYHASELVNDRVERLMPHPFSDLHTRFVEAYMKTGVAKLLGSKRGVPALHRSGATFDVMLSMTRLDVDGEVMFCGHMQKMEAQEETVVSVVINERGIVQSTKGPVQELLGYRPPELVGRSMNILLPRSVGDKHDEYLRRVVDRPFEARVIGGAGQTLEAVRKTGESIPVQVDVVRDESLAAHGVTLFTGRLTPLFNLAGSVTANAEGAILTANDAAARIFGYPSGDALRGSPITALLPDEEPGRSLGGKRATVGKHSNGSPIPVFAEAATTNVGGESFVSYRVSFRNTQKEQQLGGGAGLAAPSIASEARTSPLSQLRSRADVGAPAPAPASLAPVTLAATTTATPQGADPVHHEAPVVPVKLPAMEHRPEARRSVRSSRSRKSKANAQLTELGEAGSGGASVGASWVVKKTDSPQFTPLHSIAELDDSETPGSLLHLGAAADREGGGREGGDGDGESDRGSVGSVEGDFDSPNARSECQLQRPRALGPLALLLVTSTSGSRSAVLDWQTRNGSRSRALNEIGEDAAGAIGDPAAAPGLSDAEPASPQEQAQLAEQPAHAGAVARLRRADREHNDGASVADSLLSSTGKHRRRKRRRRVLTLLATGSNPLIGKLKRHLIIYTTVLAIIAVGTFIGAQQMVENYSAQLKHLSASSSRAVLSQLISIEARSVGLAAALEPAAASPLAPGGAAAAAERLAGLADDFYGTHQDLSFGLRGFDAPGDGEMAALVFAPDAVALSELREGAPAPSRAGLWAAGQRLYQHAAILAAAGGASATSKYASASASSSSLASGLPAIVLPDSVSRAGGASAAQDANRTEVARACLADLARCPSWHFVLRNGPDTVFEALKRATALYKVSMRRAAGLLSALYIATLVGALFLVAAVALLAIRPAFTRVLELRDEILNLFLEIPKQVVRGLAKKRMTVALDLTDSDDDDSDEDGRSAAVERDRDGHSAGAGAPVAKGAPAHQQSPGADRAHLPLVASDSSFDIVRVPASPSPPPPPSMSAVVISMESPSDSPAKPRPGASAGADRGAGAGGDNDRGTGTPTNANGRGDRERPSRRAQQAPARQVHPQPDIGARMQVLSGTAGTGFSAASLSLFARRLLARVACCVPRWRAYAAPLRVNPLHVRRRYIRSGSNADKLFRMLSRMYAASLVLIALCFAAIFVAGFVQVEKLEDHANFVVQAANLRSAAVHAVFTAREAVLGAGAAGPNATANALTALRTFYSSPWKVLGEDAGLVRGALASLEASATASPELAALFFGHWQNADCAGAASAGGVAGCGSPSDGLHALLELYSQQAQELARAPADARTAGTASFQFVWGAGAAVP